MIDRRSSLALAPAAAGGGAVFACALNNEGFMPGEHDDSLDRGTACRALFGPTHYSFDQKGVQFVAVDNASDPGARIGDEQFAWLYADLAKVDKKAPIAVPTHRPLSEE